MPSSKPNTVLEGVYWQHMSSPIKPDWECANPLEGPGATGVTSRVVKIVRMQDGVPNDNGGDVHVELANGTHFDLMNYPLAFVYKIDPLEVPLTENQIIELASKAFGLETGSRFDAATTNVYEELRARALRHSQMEQVRPKIEALRRDRAKQDALRQLAGIRDEHGQEIPPERIEALQKEPDFESEVEGAQAVLDGVGNG